MTSSRREPLTIKVLREAAAIMRAHAIPPQVIGDEEVYVMPLPENRVREAFEAGLAPFCPLPDSGHLLPWYPLGQVKP
jgi:hypothetical protein